MPLDYTDCKHEVFLTTFMKDGSDGILKLNPGGKKKRARSSKATLVLSDDLVAQSSFTHKLPF